VPYITGQTSGLLKCAAEDLQQLRARIENRFADELGF
jgi:hypothetical protein